MQSTELLRALERVPVSRKRERYGLPELRQWSAAVRQDLLSVELAIAAESALAALFEARNVPDDLFEAFRLASPSVALDHSLYERYAEILQRGPESVLGFISNLKGKLAELRLPGLLEELFPNTSFSVAVQQNQPIWDIVGTGSSGEQIFIQAKIGTAEYAGDVLERMSDDPNILFAVSEEIRNQILASHPELAQQLLDFDLSNADFTTELGVDLDVLVGNLGIDVPDELGDLLPYVGEIVLGVRLLCDIVRVERDFDSVPVDDRVRVHAIKALVLFQRFGVSTVCAALGGAAGSAMLPGIGTAAGAIGAAVLAGYLNRKLHQNGVELAMWLLRLSEEDTFYFQNKVAVDRIGESLAETARTLQERSNSAVEADKRLGRAAALPRTLAA